MKQRAGLGLRHSFHHEVLETKPAVPWFEVITENYLRFDGAPRRFLHKIRENYPLVFHGVSLSIGSLEPVRTEYLQELKKLIREFQPLWVSDHLCWTFNGPENSHDLLPVPFTKDSLKRIVEKTLRAQETLGQKIYLENPSAYVDFAHNTFSEEDFISELCKQSGCGLLLDLNNVVVNHFNLGYDPVHYLETIKNCEVLQIHVAGHTIKDQVRIDTHDHDLTQEVWDLLPLARSYWPDANPMLEWDDKIPPLSYLLEQRKKIEDVFATGTPEVQSKAYPSSISSLSIPESKAHQRFWKLLKNNDYVTEKDILSEPLLKNNLPTPAVVGMNVYSSAYYNRLLEVLEKDFPVLKVLLNDFFPDVMLAYLEKHPSVYDSIDFVGNRLSAFIAEHPFEEDFGVDKKIIADIAAFENLSGLASVAFDDSIPVSFQAFTEDDWEKKKIRLRPGVFLYRAFSEIDPVIAAVQSEQAPEVPELKDCFYIFYRDSAGTQFQKLSDREFRLFQAFQKQLSFTEGLEFSGLDMETQAKLLFAYERFFTE